jgi:hypothetical protein
VLEIVLMLGLGIPAPANPELVKLLAAGSVAPLERSGEVRATRVDNLLSPEQKAGADAESLGFPGVFRLRPGSRVLTPEDAASVRKILRRSSSYESYVTACLFEPGVAFTFPSRADLLVLVCFKCEEVAFAKGSTGLAKFSLSALGKQELLRLSSRLFPELGKQTSRGAAEQ